MLLLVNCKWKLSKRYNLTSFVLSSYPLRCDVKWKLHVLRCENDVQFDALAVVDFTMLYLITLDYLTKSPKSIAGTKREKAAFFIFMCSVGRIW